MDPIAWLIANLHLVLGHNKTAVFLGVPAGDKAECIICKFDRGEATREDVITALAPPST